MTTKQEVKKTTRYVGIVYRLKKSLGPFPPGASVYCFAQENDKIWLQLPGEWAGTSQVNLSEEVFKSII